MHPADARQLDPISQARGLHCLFAQPSILLRHSFVHHIQKESARGDMHENRAECLFSLLKPCLRVCRGVSKTNLPGSVGQQPKKGQFSSDTSFHYRHQFGIFCKYINTPVGILHMI